MGTPPSNQLGSHNTPDVDGESMTGISVSDGVVPTVGGFIAISATDHTDQWGITPEYYKANFAGEV